MLISSYYIPDGLFESFLKWKWRHDDTETSFGFTSVDFYLFLHNETFTYNIFFKFLTGFELGRCPANLAEIWQIKTVVGNILLSKKKYF